MDHHCIGRGVTSGVDLHRRQRHVAPEAAVALETRDGDAVELRSQPFVAREQLGGDVGRGRVSLGGDRRDLRVDLGLLLDDCRSEAIDL